MLLPLHDPLVERDLGGPGDLIDGYLIVLPVLFLILGFLDHPLKLLLSDGLDLLALQELEFNGDCDVELAFAVLGYKVLLVLKARLD